MALNFPVNPTLNQIYSLNNNSWIWDGNSWNSNSYNFNEYKGRKNYIINGDFSVWFRSQTQTSSGYGSDDRWRNDNNGQTKSHQLGYFPANETQIPGFPQYYSSTSTSPAGTNSTDFVLKRQLIEDVARLAKKETTLSFYARADSPKYIAISYKQYFGDGGTAVRNMVHVTKFLLTTYWAKYSVTFNWDSLEGKVLGPNSYSGIEFWFSGGSNYNSRTGNLGLQAGTFEIAQVQLEDGNVATEFEKIPQYEMFDLCNRYFERISTAGLVGITYNPNGDTRCSIQFKKLKRIPPIIAWDSTPALNVIGLGHSGVDNNVQFTPTNYAITDTMLRIALIPPNTFQSWCGDNVVWGNLWGNYINLDAEIADQ